jgi:AFG3 family protein
MTENTTNNNQGTEKKPDKTIKPRFNTNWIFAIIAVSLILFSLFNGGKAVQKTTTSEIKAMIANRDIEKLVVINKDQAEIYLKKEALESGRYPKLPAKPGTGFGMSLPKANFTYTIGDMSSFEPFILEAQKSAGYTEKEII